jgi:hypothetical protein
MECRTDHICIIFLIFTQLFVGIKVTNSVIGEIHLPYNWRFKLYAEFLFCFCKKQQTQGLQLKLEISSL